jgi:hypothetical protein
MALAALAWLSPVALAGQLLLGDQNQATGDVPPDASGIASHHIAVVTVLRNLNAQLLGDFKFQLVQSGFRLLNNELIGAAVVCHVLDHLHRFWTYYASFGFLLCKGLPNFFEATFRVFAPPIKKPTLGLECRTWKDS